MDGNLPPCLPSLALEENRASAESTKRKRLASFVGQIPAKRGERLSGEDFFFFFYTFARSTRSFETNSFSLVGYKVVKVGWERGGALPPWRQTIARPSAPKNC